MIVSEHSSDYISALVLELGITDASRVAEFVIPRMQKAVNHLTRRDIDNDGLLEQNYNEDWMDTTLRAGKVVYSQARGEVILPLCCQEKVMIMKLVDWQG